MNRTDVEMNKPMCLDLLITDISKIAIHEYWYNYIKPKYEDKAKLFYPDRYGQFGSSCKI